MAMPVKDSQVSVRLPADLKDRMETRAQLTRRSKSCVAMEALSKYLAWRIPQIDDLKQAIAAADQGDFASEAEVAAVFSRYSGKRTARPNTASTARRAAPQKRR